VSCLYLSLFQLRQVMNSNGKRFLSLLLSSAVSPGVSKMWFPEMVITYECLAQLRGVNTFQSVLCT
jgi:hypothetical protein